MDRNTHPRGRAYQCLHCLRKGREEINSKARLEEHIYKQHVPNDDQPFFCRVCHFRSKSKDSLFCHVRTFSRHKAIMKEKGFTASEPFLVCNDSPYRVGEKDWKMLSKDESTRWWTKKAEGSGASLIDQAIQMEVPEIYSATKYIENAMEKDLDEECEGEIEEKGTTEGHGEAIRSDERGTDKGKESDDKAKRVEESEVMEGPLDLRGIKVSEQVKKIEGVGATDVANDSVPLDLRVIRVDEDRRVVKCVDDSEDKRGGTGNEGALNLTVIRKNDKSSDDEKVRGVVDCGKEKDRVEKKSTEVKDCEVTDDVVELDEQAEDEVNEVDRATDELVKEMRRDDARKAGDKNGKMAEESVLPDQVYVDGTGEEAEEQVVGADYMEEANELSGKRKTESTEAGARKRVRQSLKRYKNLTDSSSSSSSSSDESSSDEEEEAEARREKRFTSILGEMIRKSGNIVGEQVIANAGLIRKLQRSVDDLMKEVKGLRRELKQRKDGEEQHRESKAPTKEDGNRHNTGHLGIGNNRRDREQTRSTTEKMGKENRPDKRANQKRDDRSNRTERPRDIPRDRQRTFDQRGRHGVRGKDFLRQ